MSKRLREHPVLAAVVYIFCWAAVSCAIFYIGKAVTTALVTLLGFLIVYPAGTVYMSFHCTRQYGLKWYFIAPTALLALLAYSLLGFDDISPNFLVMTALAMFFGCGLGKVFYVDVPKTKKLSKKELAERNYKSIIDDK